MRLTSNLSLRTQTNNARWRVNKTSRTLSAAAAWGWRSYHSLSCCCCWCVMDRPEVTHGPDMGSTFNNKTSRGVAPHSHASHLIRQDAPIYLPAFAVPYLILPCSIFWTREYNKMCSTLKGRRSCYVFSIDLRDRFTCTEMVLWRQTVSNLFFFYIHCYFN